MKLVLGIGNPGHRYARTRHNVGFRVVDAWAASRGLAFRKVDELALEASEGDRVTLVKPLTYVNRSGRVARTRLDRLGLGPEDMLVVVDDVHLPFGRLRLKPRGSSGGHNGLKDVTAALGTDDWPRLRIGVGGPEGTDLVEHVLGPFGPEEERDIGAILDRAVETVGAFVEGRSLEELMAGCNRVIDVARGGGGAGVQKEP
ncbi:MAG: aminoacyl-tRNA hydrolase [Planctomycetota bacterium]